MSINPFIYPAKLISYDSVNRTAQVSISGLTDGVAEGIEAMLAYPIGDDDLDTERELLAGADVWVFFEQGDITMPVVCFYRRHGEGRAITDIRRIRQKNIELLARASITLNASDLVQIQAKDITLTGKITIAGNVEQTGNYTMTGNQQINGGQSVYGDSESFGNIKVNGSITATGDMKAAGVSLKSHRHGGVKSGGDTTSTPN